MTREVMLITSSKDEVIASRYDVNPSFAILVCLHPAYTQKKYFPDPD